MFAFLQVTLNLNRSRWILIVDTLTQILLTFDFHCLRDFVRNINLWCMVSLSGELLYKRLNSTLKSDQ